MFYSDEDWWKVFETNGALWVHDGNPEHPHAELQSGRHSDGYFNSSNIVSIPALLKVACMDIIEKAGLSELRHHQLPNVVFGQQMGSVPMAYELARLLGAGYGYTEKNPSGRMAVKRFSVTADSSILLAEDTVTSGETTMRSIRALTEAGGTVWSPVLALFNRSGMNMLKTWDVVALVEHEIGEWEPNECPLCRDGSTAVRPKQNWKKLTAS